MVPSRLDVLLGALPLGEVDDCDVLRTPLPHVPKHILSLALLRTKLVRAPNSYLPTEQGIGERKYSWVPAQVVHAIP